MTHDGTFQRVDDREDDAFGPQAILVSGFTPDIETKLREVLDGLGATGHRVLFCTPEMVKQPLGEALTVESPGAPAAPDALPRVMVLSGLSSAQLQGFLKAYGSAGLPRPIFASATPPNLTFPVGKLIMELLREQRAMNRQR